MSEWKLFGDTSYVSTFEFHEHRERAPHLEQDAHRHRLLAALELIRSIPGYRRMTVSDLGCGDGGLLQLLTEDKIDCWGYDFCPANAAGWIERGVTGVAVDWVKRGYTAGDIVVLTEVLEHLEEPHQQLRKLYNLGARWIVASSPMNEDAQAHAEEHAWAWDWDGYEQLLTGAGFKVVSHTNSLWSQLILAGR
jgi:2-polyprenyl-3-methyl-5-hydroxy-6-metoxy-1,4-benzoquinol methylase